MRRQRTIGAVKILVDLEVEITHVSIAKVKKSNATIASVAINCTRYF